jgi:GDP-L-fucose synthase
MLDKESKIYIAGHRGMVGSAIVNELEDRGYKNLIYQTGSELDLRDQQAVNKYVTEEKPDTIIIAAAMVGGILANGKYPYQFIYDNLAIETTLVSAAHKNVVEKVLLLGSS